jgi:hypothetical protein
MHAGFSIPIGPLVGAAQVRAQAIAAALPPRDLRHTYGRFDGFDLTEERGDGLELVMAPVDEQTWVAGVTPQSDGLGMARQVSTWPRISLMKPLTSYSCATVESSWASLSTNSAWPPLRCFFRGLGTGVISSDRRRPETGGMSSGCPSASRA